MSLKQGSVRIIAGEWRHRVVSFPSRLDLRPTPNRVRETVFNWLGQDLSGKVCLDLFAGSGAMGFEAASRGAKQVVMVESDQIALKALQNNINQLSAVQIKLVKTDALAFVTAGLEPFDVVFLDPPYRLNLLSKLLSLLSSQLATSTLVYIESEKSFICDQPWQVWRHKQAGKVCYQLLKLKQNG